MNDLRASGLDGYSESLWSAVQKGSITDGEAAELNSIWKQSGRASNDRHRAHVAVLSKFGEQIESGSQLQMDQLAVLCRKLKVPIGDLRLEPALKNAAVVNEVTVQVKSLQAKGQLTSIDRDQAEDHLAKHGLNLGHLPAEIVNMLRAAPVRKPPQPPEPRISRHQWVLRAFFMGTSGLILVMIIALLVVSGAIRFG